jgi:lysophospholipase L1-like esterase
MLRLLQLTAVLAFLALSTATPVNAAPRRIYYIGNSVTDTINYKGLANLAASRNIEVLWARHMIPGSPLFLLWQGDGGFTEGEFGPSKKALAEFPWDIVTVQPFDRLLTSDNGTEGDLEIIPQMIDAQLKQNPQVQFYVYARWPRMQRPNGSSFEFDKYDYDPTQPGNRPDLAQVADWHTLWNRKFSGGWDNTNETRDYFEQVVAGLRRARPDMARPVLMIPVGDVFDALGKKMKAGQVPGFDNVWLLYKDGIHMNTYGSYLTALTFYATMFRQDPTGLPTKDYGSISPELAKIFQQTVWEVVKDHPLSGVKN